MNGNKLRKLRIKEGLKQEELGQKLNIKASTIGMYEQGRREPNNEMLKRIATFFNVSTDFLLDIEKPMTNNEKILREKDILRNTLIENGYMENNEDLSDEELKKLIEFVKINKQYIKDIKD